ncbi:TetR/AcrR family transcriptional regulator [Jannaschia sp. W003]|uniref:TetR/AcrR family transcriptional regulator n=1 Tax=Jannaschia sp. W003 TaxID=2867012 RepID=UPI0021A627CF|nr:TetR/AcrR family transcriptional regulator [Jannaschia sp. W003]UWQ20144.1 TetR/AcrR family transcriptional regulator [Jannaschia sp. W003]
MNDTERKLLDAALRVFSRYGVKRTSMGDLCEEAGVSRQTFYNTFRNKDDILRALIRSYSETALEEIAAGLADCATLADRLDLVFDRAVVSGFDMVAAMPNAEDFVDGAHASAREEIDAAGERFRAVIAELLQPHAPSIRAAGIAVPDLADCMQRASKAAARHACDREHLLTQLATLRQLCVAAAGDPAVEPRNTE